MCRRILMLAAILFVALLILRFNQSSEGFTGGSSKELVIVKAEWCGHCKKAMPQFNQLVRNSPIKLQDGSEVKVRLLDEANDKAEVKMLGVSGFPTIKYMVDGEAQDYNGPRTYDGVLSFLQGQ